MSLQNIARKFNYVVAFCFIIIVFFYSLIPVYDNDFWWQLKTGELILDSRAVPETDPFSYTADDLDDTGRTAFIMRQYWVGQVVFFKIVDLFSLKGFVVMRGLVFALTALFVLLLIGHQRAVPLGIVPLFLLALITTECLTDRPQMFSFLFTAVVLYLMEKSVENKAYVFFVPPIMLLWANIHAGYLVGAVVLLCYLASMPFEKRLKQHSKYLVPVVLVSILLTFLNPNHWDAVIRVIGSPDVEIIYRTNIEYRSPISIFPYTMKNPGWIAYWALIALCVCSSGIFIWKRSWSRAVILTGTAAASLISVRYTYFFAPVAAALTVVAFGLVFREKKSLYVPAAFVGMALLVFLAVRIDPGTLLKKDTIDGFFPERAVSHIIDNDIPGPIFNNANWGGYLIWRLWPEYKVFIDTRFLRPDVYRQYLDITADRSGNSRLILDSYGIKTVITPAIDIYSGEIIPLVRALYNDKNWAVVYFDGVALIFVKDIHAKEKLPRTVVYQEVLNEVRYWYPFFPAMPGYVRSAAEARKALRAK